MYKAILRRAGGAAELVAVKTLKGMSLMIIAPFTLTSLDRAKRGSLFSAC